MPLAGLETRALPWHAPRRDVMASVVVIRSGVMCIPHDGAIARFYGAMMLPAPLRALIFPFAGERFRGHAERLLVFDW